MSASISDSDLDFGSDSEATGSTPSENSYAQIAPSHSTGGGGGGGGSPKQGAAYAMPSKQKSSNKLRPKEGKAHSRSRESSKGSKGSKGGTLDAAAAIGSAPTLSNSHDLLRFSIGPSLTENATMAFIERNLDATGGHHVPTAIIVSGGMADLKAKESQGLDKAALGEESKTAGHELASSPPSERKKSPYQRRAKPQKTVAPVIGGYYSTKAGHASPEPSEISLSDNPDPNLLTKKKDADAAQSKGDDEQQGKSASHFNNIPLAPAVVAKSEARNSSTGGTEPAKELALSFSTPPPSAGSSSQHTLLGDVRVPSFRTQLRQERAGIVMTFVFPVDSSHHGRIGGGSMRAASVSGDDAHLHGSQSPKYVDGSLVAVESQYTSSFSPTQMPTKLARSVSTASGLPSHHENSSSRPSTGATGGGDGGHADVEEGRGSELVITARTDGGLNGAAVAAEATDKEPRQCPEPHPSHERDNDTIIPPDAAQPKPMSSFAAIPVVDKVQGTPTTVAATVAMMSFEAEDTFPHPLVGQGSSGTHHLSLSTTQQPVQGQQTAMFSYDKAAIASIDKPPKMDLMDRSAEEMGSSKTAIRRKSSLIVVASATPPPSVFAAGSGLPMQTTIAATSPRDTDFSPWAPNLNQSGSQRPQSGGSNGGSLSRVSALSSSGRAASASPRSPSEYSLTRRPMPSFSPQLPNQPQPERQSSRPRHASGASPTSSSRDTTEFNPSRAERGSDNPLTVFAKPVALMSSTSMSPQPPLGRSPHSNNASTNSAYLGGSFSSGRGGGGGGGGAGLSTSSGRSPRSANKSGASTPRKLAANSKEEGQPPAQPTLPSIKVQRGVAV